MIYSVDLKNINKVYKINEELNFQALTDINLQIKKGELVAIVGPSGSGKSTLMNILGLLDRPSSGQYFLDGSDTSKLKDRANATLRNKKIGFIFQNFNLLNRTSALENVAMPLIYAGVSSRDRHERARKMLEIVGLGDKLESHPNQLSGGQQQRVAVARALVTDPEIILADEPTGNLDSKTGDEIMTLLKKLNKEGKTIILITHSLDIARAAKKVIQIKDGRVV